MFIKGSFSTTFNSDEQAYREKGTYSLQKENKNVNLIFRPSDRPNGFALGGETWASGDGPPAAELWGRRQHPGQPGNYGPDVCIREGPHARRKTAAGEESVWPHPDRQGEIIIISQPTIGLVMVVYWNEYMNKYVAQFSWYNGNLQTFTVCDD